VIVTNRPRSRALRSGTPLAALIAAAAVVAVPTAAWADPGTPVPLGAGATFVVLAEAGVTNTGATTLGGDIGSFATTSITGAGTITQASGVNHGGDLVTQQAKIDLVTAYNAASSQTPDPLGGVELAGLTLEPGVYDTGGVIELNGNLTLDANGDPEAVFIFHSTATLLAGAASSITFIDGATACNLYWRVPSSADIMAGSQFAGTILAEATIAFRAGATLTGRAMSQSGQVTLINNTIMAPVCSSSGGTGGSAGTVTALRTGGPLVAAPGGTAAAPGAPAVPQGPVVPRGGIATGDGSSLAATSADGPAIAVLAVLGLGAVLLTARARRLTR
jgi:type VI secretion system secreted protein VgrG